MEFIEVYNKTNNHGKKFLDTWFKNSEILGIEITESNKLRREFTIVYKAVVGFATAILPLSTENCDSCCFFGDIEHFSMIFAEEKANVKLKLRNNGRLLWPVWYLKKEDFLRWEKYYNEMVKKYS